MVQNANFWDKRAEGYAKSPVRDEEAYKEKLEITRRYFQPESEVFEFACGTGTTAVAHAPYVKNIVAVDISSKMIEIAKDKARSASVENIDFQQSTIEEFSADDESFDVVMAHSILHLLETPEQAITKVYKLLKPGGVFVSSTVCLGGAFSPWRIFIFLGRLFNAIPYVNILKREKLEEYFTNAGFEVEFQWERRKGQAAFLILRKPQRD